MSIEQTIVELTLAINRLAINLQANTETGHRIISTLNNSESNFVATTHADDAVTVARESSEVETEAEAPAPAKRTRASRAKPVVEAPAPDPTITTQQESPIADAPAITLSDIREHALGYRDRNGLDAARALLATFSVERIGDLDYNQYGDFLKACAP